MLLLFCIPSFSFAGDLAVCVRLLHVPPICSCTHQRTVLLLSHLVVLSCLPIELFVFPLLGSLLLSLRVLALVAFLLLKDWLVV